MAQRKKFKVIGGTISCTMRPTMALPAHSKGGMVSNRTVEGVIRAFMQLVRQSRAIEYSSEAMRILDFAKSRSARNRNLAYVLTRGVPAHLGPPISSTEANHAWHGTDCGKAGSFLPIRK